MSSANTIREFLVGLGFQVDENGLRKFTTEILGASAVAAELGAAVAGAAVATVAFVGKVADSMTDLYWSGQRLRSGVADIKGYGLAVQQMGGNAQEAQQSLEGLAAFLREHPNGERYLQMMFGVSTRDKQGLQRQVTDIMGDLGVKLKNMPFWRAKVFANFLGIDDMTLMAMQRGLGKVKDSYKDLFKSAGMDPQKAALGLKDFNNQLERIEATLYVMAVGASFYLLPVVTRLADGFESILKWLIKVDGEIQANWVRSGWAKSIDGAVDSVLGLWNALKQLMNQLGLITTDSTNWLRPFKELIDVMKLLVDYTTQLALLMSGRWKDSWAMGKTIARDWTQIAQDVNEDLHSGGKKGGAGGPRRSSSSGGSRQSIALSFFRAMGWSEADAAALAGNMQFESSGLNPNEHSGDHGRAYGIAEWGPARQALFRKIMGRDIHGSSLGDQLNFAQWELTHSESGAARMIRAARTLSDKVIAVRQGYERPSIAHDDQRIGIAQQFLHWFNEEALAGDRSLGGSPATRASGASVVLHQKTDIRIEGHGSAIEVGRRVGENQDRVNGNLLRNFRGAFA